MAKLTFSCFLFESAFTVLIAETKATAYPLPRSGDHERNDATIPTRFDPEKATKVIPLVPVPSLAPAIVWPYAHGSRVKKLTIANNSMSAFHHSFDPASRVSRLWKIRVDCSFPWRKTSSRIVSSEVITHFFSM